MYGQLFELHADLLKALAHPRRLEIIHLLRDQQLCVSDIHAMLDLPQANISQHLTVLRDAGVVAHDRQGKQIFYSVRDQRFVQACDLLRAILIDHHQGTEVANQFNLEMKELVPLVHDPVCGMRLSPRTAGFSHQYKEKYYFFCASGCLKHFINQPEAYV